MKIFISWSGDRSKHIALAFRKWLRRLSPAIQPWMSSVDIQKGFSWDSAIAKELNESKVGLICLTSDNLDSTYLHYEAGAISNVVGSNVYTFLFQINDTDVHQPLSRFQNTKYNKQDILQLVRDINFKLRELGETDWDDEALEENFELIYPKLEEELNKAPAAGKPKRERSNEEMFDELLRAIRSNEPKQERQSSTRPLIRAASYDEIYKHVNDYLLTHDVSHESAKAIINEITAFVLKRLGMNVSVGSRFINQAIDSFYTDLF